MHISNAAAMGGSAHEAGDLKAVEVVHTLYKLLIIS